MRLTKLINLLLFTTPALTVGLAVVSILVHNFWATNGADLKSLTLQAQTLGDQNVSLRQKIAQASSLSWLKTQAPTFGFASPEEVVYLNLSQSLAQAAR